MPTLRIEHPINSFETWKQAFDRDPAGRERSGALSYRVLQPADDPHYIVIDLEFADTERARAFATAMQEVWKSKTAAPALQGTPQARLFELIESEVYAGSQQH